MVTEKLSHLIPARMLVILNLLFDNTLFQIVLSAILIPMFLIWVVWVAEHRPKSDPEKKEVYIDDTSFRRVEEFDCSIDWGTKLFPFRHLKLLDAPVSASVLILFTPQGGLEKPLQQDYFEANPVKNRMKKPIKLKQRKFFTDCSSGIHVFVQTPIERQEYSNEVKHEIKDDILRVWNKNREEIRNFRLLLSRPIKLDGIEVIKGSLVSVEMDIPYSSVKALSPRKLGTISTDISITLVLNLPQEGLSGEEHVIIKFS